MKYTHTRISTHHKAILCQLASDNDTSMLSFLHRLIDSNNTTTKVACTNLSDVIEESKKEEKKSATPTPLSRVPTGVPYGEKIPSFEEFCKKTSLPADKLRPVYERKYGKN